jgi:hypothetical protein
MTNNNDNYNYTNNNYYDNINNNMMNDGEFDDMPELIPVYNNMINMNNINNINYYINNYINNQNIINTPPLNAHINNDNIIPLVLNDNIINDDEFEDMPELIPINYIMYFILINNDI